MRYLEALLIQRALAAKRVVRSNVRKPETMKRKLPEADRSNMSAFFANISLVLPVIGIDIFRPRVTIPEESEVSVSPEFRIQNKAGIEATMVETQGEYVIKNNSTAMLDAGFPSRSYSQLKRSLIDKGQLTKEDNFYRFTENTPFTSPSAAAIVVLDQKANGQTKWKIKGTKMSYADWQARKSKTFG